MLLHGNAVQNLSDSLIPTLVRLLYRGDVGRTRMKQLRIARVDVCAVLVCAALFAAVIVLRRYGL